MSGEELEITLGELAWRLAADAGDRRLLVAIAGPPGAGKSTCAQQLEKILNGTGKCRSAIFTMDGYHYDDGILISRGLRPREGAPETFDVSGFRHMLNRLKQNDETEVVVPVFDRKLEISRSAARTIRHDVNVLIVEGNYILLRREPWSILAPLFDVTVNIRVPEEVLRQRLYARWEGHGIPREDIPAKVEANDLPNGVFVLAESIKSDFVLRT